MQPQQLNINSAMNTMTMHGHVSRHFDKFMYSNSTLYDTVTDTGFLSHTLVMFIQIFAVSLFATFTNNLGDGILYLKNVLWKFTRKILFMIFFNPMKNFYTYIYKKITNQKPKYKIERIISLITSESKRNVELLEIIQWFISSDYCKKKNRDKLINNNSKEIYFQTSPSCNIYQYDNEAKNIPFNICPLINDDFIILFEEHEIICVRDKTKIELNGDMESQKRDNITYYLQTYHEDENSEILERFCTRAVKCFNTSRKEWKQLIYTNKNNSWDKCKEIFSADSVDSVCLKEGIKEGFVASLDFFFANKDFYKKQGQRHKYVTLLLGPPGTGKTTFVTAYANQNKRHIYSLNLKDSREGDLANLIDTLDTKKGDLLIDDFDHYYSVLGNTEKSGQTEKSDVEDIDFEYTTKNSEHTLRKSDQTKNKEKKSMISYHELLTVLDGTGSKEGLNVYICINDPSKIFKSMNIEDMALVRERRVNKIIKFEYCDHTMIKNIYKNIIGKEPNMDIVKLIKEDFYAPCTISQQFISLLETHGGKIHDKQKELDKVLLDLANNNIKTNQEKILDYIDSLRKYNINSNSVK